jgi:hypothetical protein
MPNFSPGAVGPQGAQGAQGAGNVQGFQGAPGAVGNFQGFQGAQGPAYSGPEPPTGNQGAQGPFGPQGAQGPIGAQGAQGAQGPPSDKRLKTNVKPLQNVRSRVIGMKGVKFEWRDNIPQIEGYKPIHKYLLQGKSIGFIAQEIEKLFPEVVSTDIYGFKNLQYDLLVSVGVATLQENNLRTNNLNTKLNQLKKLISG